MVRVSLYSGSMQSPGMHELYYSLFVLITVHMKQAVCHHAQVLGEAEQHAVLHAGRARARQRAIAPGPITIAPWGVDKATAATSSSR